MRRENRSMGRNRIRMNKQSYAQEKLKECGFDEILIIKTDKITFDEQVYTQCRRNTCKCYNKNYACPPLNGTFEQNKMRVLKYQNAIIACKIMSIATSAEYRKTQSIIPEIIKKLRNQLEDKGYKILGEGPCDICEECAAIKGDKCRFPDRIRYSMEGSAIDVVKTSMDLNMTYNAGGGKIGYFVMVLFNQEQL